MILPIVAYGDPVLRKKAKEIKKDYPNLEELVDNMWDTMYNAHGVGLAAPQVGIPLRLFVIDPSAFAEDENLEETEKETLNNLKKVFINPQIVEEEGEEWAFNEGCLSIPDIREDVFRKPKITIEYQDEDFVTHTETYEGLGARVIQHEYDHIEGILFTDKLSSLKKRLIKGRLNNISKGKVEIDYRMRFPALKKDVDSFDIKWRDMIFASQKNDAMGLEKILSISGKPGLYELTAQTRGGFIAKSITDGKQISVNVRHNVSLLSEIAVYTYTEEVPLGTIFQKIHEKEDGGQAIDHKSSKKELEAYFAEILPDYDVDRVYQSDIKKIIQWYNLLVDNGFTDFSKEETKENVEAEGEEAGKETVKEKGKDEEE